MESMSTVPSSSTEAREDVIPKDLILFITLITAGCSIDDAIMCFLKYKIDFLFIGDYILQKRKKRLSNGYQYFTK